MITMADPVYNGVSITTTVPSATLASHCIPAYPEAKSNTTYNAAFYTARKASNAALTGATITYVVQS